METELSASVVVSYVIVALIQWAKRQRWIPIIDFDTAKANRVVAAAMALITSIGIHATYNSADGSLLVTGLAWSSILPLMGEALRQFILQQLIYKGAGFEARSEAVTQDGIDPKRFTSSGAAGAAILIGSAVLVGALGVSACGVSLTKPPVVTPADTAHVRDLAVKGLAGLEIAGIVMRDGQALVSDLHAAGVVPLETRRQVNEAVIAANKVVQDVITGIDRVVRQVDTLATVTTIKGLMAEAAKGFGDLAAVLELQSDARIVQAGTFLRRAVAAVTAMIGGQA